MVSSISNSIDRKFIDQIQLSDWEIETDTGWHNCTEVSKTIEYQVYELHLENCMRLKCADTHIVFDENFNEVFIKDLSIGDYVQTRDGPITIENIVITDSYEHMYDVSVDSTEHRYYSNGILSHNTTTAAGFLLWYAMFNPDKTVLIAANKFKAASEIMQRVKFGYEETPDYIRAAIKVYNATSIEFDNGSRIISTTTTPDSGRGLSISLLYIDEMAFIKPRIAEDFWTAMSPTLATGGKCIITSTPNTDEDKFAEIWFGALKTVDDFGNTIAGDVGYNGFKAFTTEYDSVPGRDAEWMETEIAKIGMDKFRREYRCEFVTSEDTLITPAKLLQLQGKEPLYKTHGEVRWYDTISYEKMYLVALDPSAGVGRDFSAIQIFSLPDMKQVGEWSHNRTPIPQQVRTMQQIINWLYAEMQRTSPKKFEPEIFFTIENNTWGESALNTISDIGEDKFNGLFMHEPKVKGQARPRKGLNTNGRTKALACSKLKTLVEQDRIILSSRELVRQLKFFVAKGNSFEGKTGVNDDAVMATLLCVRMMQMLQHWDEKIGDIMKDTWEDDMPHEAPMPVVL